MNSQTLQTLKTVAFVQANLLLAVVMIAGGAFAWRQISPAAGSDQPVPVVTPDGNALLDAVTDGFDGRAEAAIYRAELYRGLAELVERDDAIKSTDHFRRLHALAGQWTFHGNVEPLTRVNKACEAYLTHVMGGRPNVTLDRELRSKLADALVDLAEACEAVR